MFRYINLLFTIALLLFCSCNQDSVNTGDVEVSLESISPYVNNRAYIRADQLVLTIEDSLGNVIDEYVGTNSYDNRTRTSLILSEGDYRINAKVYNLNNGDYYNGDDPVTQGDSGLFTVIRGDVTQVSIPLLPYDPTYLGEYVTSNINTDDKSTIYDNNYIGTVRSEEWFVSNPSTDLTRIYINDDDSTYNGAAIFAYDSSGSFLGSSKLVGELVISSTPLDDIYLAVLPLSYASIDFGTVEIISEPVDDNLKPSVFTLVEGYNSSYYSALDEYVEFNFSMDSQKIYFFHWISGTSQVFVEGLPASHPLTMYWNERTFFIYNSAGTDLGIWFNNDYYDVDEYKRDSINTLCFRVDSEDIRTVNTDGNWYEYDTSVSYYTFYADENSTYTISIDDKYDGSGLYDGNVTVKVMDAFGDTSYSNLENCYTNPVDVSYNSEQVFIQVDSEIDGNFAIRVEETVN